MVAIASGARVYLDANVVIYFVEAFPEYLPQVEALFAAVVAADAVLVTSELTLAEVLVKPMRDGRDDIVREYEAFLTSGEIELVPISREVLRQSASLRANLRMKTPDAIHVATAVAHGCTVFASNDAGIHLPGGLAAYTLV